MAGFFIKVKVSMTEEVYFIADHIYQDRISVVFSNNIRKSIEDQCGRIGIKSRKYIPVKDAAAVVCNVNEKNYKGIWMAFDINDIDDGIIVHECLHVAVALCIKRGLQLNYSTEEAYAYLIQWLFKEVKCFQEKFLDGQKKKSK